MKLQVLVVDDNRELAENLAEILTDEGCRVCTAFSAEEALTAAEGARFDLVLTDIRMPGMNGVELIRRLALLDPGAVFLLMTAYTSDQVLTSAASLGVVRAVLAKPLAVDKLLDLLPRRERVQVLLVEDDPALASSLGEGLRERGYQVEIGGSLASARALLTSARPDLAVIDGRTPDGEGMAFARALCSDPQLRRAGLPTLVFTAEEGAADEAELRRRAPAAIEFVHAPVSAASLLSALRKIEEVES